MLRQAHEGARTRSSGRCTGEACTGSDNRGKYGNQDVLVSERDKYGANDIKPGLTGWAQINGRDELELPDKAKLDGEYSQMLAKGGFGAFLFDIKCFLGTVFSVLRSDGVVEGGTGEMKK